MFFTILLHSKHLKINWLSLKDILSSLDLQSVNLLLWILSNEFLTCFDNEVDIYLKLSINFNLHVIFLPLSSFFLIGTKKVIYFSVFSPKN